MSQQHFDTSDMGPLIELSGTVAERPTVRMRPVGEGNHPMPVLQITLHNVGALTRGRVTCEQVFPLGQVAAAHARAAQLKPGMRVTVQAPLQLMEVHLPCTAHIRVEKPKNQPQPQEPCHA